MPAYKYEALNAAGRTQTGLLEADNPRAARSQLREMQLTPLAVEVVAQQQAQTGGLSLLQPRVFGAATLAVWTRQLAGLVGSRPAAGARADRLADEANSRAQRELLAQLQGRGQRRGAPFARALATAPREFDEVYRGVVAAGEQSGALGAGARAPGRRPGRAPGAAQPSCSGLRLPGHRLGGRRGHRDLSRHLCGAAGGQVFTSTQQALPWLTGLRCWD
jgi:type II secretory pathway component PulF